MKRILSMLGVIVLIGTLTTSSFAEMNLYGSARMSTFYTMEDEDKSVSGKDDVDFSEWLQTNARVGANITTGDVKGRFEYGTKNDVADVRLLYGTWEFEQGTLLVGKDYSLIDSHMISNVSYADDALFLSIGIPYAGRTPQVRVTIGNLSIAALKPCNSDTIGLKSEDGAIVDVDTYSPKLELAYNIAMDSVKATLFGGFNAYKVGFTAKGDTNQKDYEIYSGIAGARCMIAIDDAYLNGALFYAMNGGNYGLALEGAAKTAELSEGDVENSSSLGGSLIGGSKINDMFAVEAGVGYVQNDVDSAKDPDATMAVYAQLRYTPVKEVLIIPEVGYVDYMDDKAGETQGSKLYAGAKWQINF